MTANPVQTGGERAPPPRAEHGHATRQGGQRNAAEQQRPGRAATCAVAAFAGEMTPRVAPQRSAVDDPHRLRVHQHDRLGSIHDLQAAPAEPEPQPSQPLIATESHEIDAERAPCGTVNSRLRRGLDALEPLLREDER